MSRPPNTERNAELVRRALAGEAPSALAAAFGISRRRVHQILDREAVDRPRWGMTPAQRRARVRDWRARLARGESIKEIAFAHRTTIWCVYSALRRSPEGPRCLRNARTGNEARDAEIARRLRAGEKPRELARHYGLSCSRFKALAGELGIDLMALRSERAERARQAVEAQQQQRRRDMLAHEADDFLARAVARECDMAFVRHPQPTN